MPAGIWPSENQRTPELGTPGRLRVDPAAKEIIRKFKRFGFLNAVGMGEFGAVRAMELEVECAVHDGAIREGTRCTCPVEFDDEEVVSDDS